MTDPFPNYARFPVIGGTRIHYYTLILLFASAIILYVVMNMTRIDYEIRVVGSNPEAADAAGVNVHLVRYLCVLLGGLLGGLGGDYITLFYTPFWKEGIIRGRGCIALSLTIFSLWNPLGSIIGAYLFGGVEVLQFYLQEYRVPASLLKTLPYATTLIVLTVSSIGFMRKRLGAPAALGKPYRRES